MAPSPRSRRSHHRFGQVQVSSDLCLCEPRRQRGVKQAVSYGARSDTRPPAPNLDLLKSALSENIMDVLIFIFKPKTAFTTPGHARLSGKQKKQWLTQTISLAPGRARAGSARDGWIHALCTPSSVPTANYGGQNAPARFHGALYPVLHTNSKYITDSILKLTMIQRSTLFIREKKLSGALHEQLNCLQVVVVHVVFGSAACVLYVRPLPANPDTS